ncbi:MAG TPA: rhomboid family intramembrane serine protease [Gaiella sp.]|nr:rhomboid family intramembrane serine protease [Gaiella sp.]
MATAPAPRCYRHPDRETLVSCSECGRPICEECMNFGPVGIKCPEHAAVKQSRVRAATSPRQVRQAQRRVAGLAAPATVGLVALNVLVYLVTIYQGSGIDAPGGKVFEDGALIGAAIDLNGDWYRLVTAMFLHAGILHIAFNMLVLYWLGTIVEQALGTWRFLLVYFVSGLAGSAGALLLTNPLEATVGASGAIFGIMGALLVLEYVATGTLAGQALTLIVLNLVLTFAFHNNISVGGHIGGLVGGILATFALVHFRHTRPRWIGPALVVAVGVASVVVAAVRVENYDYGGSLAQPPTATAVTPLSASAAWAAASRASGTRYGEHDT